MVEALGIFVAVIYTTLGVLLVGLFIRRLRKGWAGFTPLPYEPVVDPYAPAPVVVNTAVRCVGFASIGWAVVHLCLVAVALVLSAGLLGKYELQQTAAPFALAAYVALAAVLAGSGGVLLKRGLAGGRRLISWGLLLFVIASLWMAAFALRLPSDSNVPPQVRPLGYPLAAVLGAHVIIDSVLGMLAQRVGKSAVGQFDQQALQDQQLLRQWDTQGGIGP